MAARAQRLGGGANTIATSTSSTMRARPCRPRRPRILVVASSKKSPPATTTLPRPPRPPGTAPVPSSIPSTPIRPREDGDSAPPPPPPPPRHLVDPIAISAVGSRTLSVSDRGGRNSNNDDGSDLSLDAYMRLPPSQYSALDPELIRRGGSAGGNGSGGGKRSDPLVLLPSPPPTALFTLSVPRASLLGIWLEPIVSVRVEGASAEKKSVRLASTACDLKGSPAVEKLRINDVFALRFEALLTWAPGGSITAKVSTEVWADPVGPFKLIPRGVISTAGDALLRGLTAALLPTFLSKLGKDYERWASDLAYRREREAMPREGERA